MYPRMHHFQVYYQNRVITWSDHLKMDAFVEEPVKLRCFGKESFYISIASILSTFLKSLSQVYRFSSLNVCLGMLVSLEPFPHRGLWFSHKASILSEN